MKKIIGTALLLLLALGARAQQLVVISSPNLHADDSVLVFIPQQFEDNYSDRYCVDCCGEPDPVPALFLLHGWSGCYRDWRNHYDIQQIADESGFIIICPDGFYDSWYVNANDPSGMQWRDFFDKELYPKMKEKYYLNPEKTFITGLSMGGHGAINLFLDDPSRFRAAGSMSGVLDLAYEHGRLGLAGLLGPYDDPANKRHAEESAVNRIERAKDTGKLMVISCGYSDSLFGASRAFCDRCKELGVPYIEIASPGTHSWKYWGYALKLHLWYFSRILNEENLGY
jgi:S-formylglutathione hydrolase FrmB